VVVVVPVVLLVVVVLGPMVVKSTTKDDHDDDDDDAEPRYFPARVLLGLRPVRPRLRKACPAILIQVII
jgi:hypothetical protein